MHTWHIRKLFSAGSQYCLSRFRLLGAQDLSVHCGARQSPA